MLTKMKPSIKREKHVIDASSKVLGYLSVDVANLLRGKHKTDFVHHIDIGDFVEIVNPHKIVLTGNKDNKKYYRHTGYIGNLKEETLKEKMARKPEEIIYLAVKGMLPKNRLQKQWLKRLSFRKEETINAK